ncbi:MAG: glycerol-3-phosphate acyltransferase, partial [Cyanobacteria bacterium J06641_2]
MSIWLGLCGAVLVAAYLLGSTPTGYTLVKLLKGIDIREVGSGSTGATNVLRTLGKGPGAFVLLVDCL